MSESSYRRNVARGVTGSSFPTCYPAALERISPDHSLPPDIYQTYNSFMSWYEEDDPQLKRILNPSYKDMITQIAWELGELTCSDVEFYSVDTYPEFASTIGHLVRRECRVVVDIVAPDHCLDGCVHSLGLLPSEDSRLFKLVSNYTPRPLQGLVTLEAIYDCLTFPDEPVRTMYPFSYANVTALPPID